MALPSLLWPTQVPESPSNPSPEAQAGSQHSPETAQSKESPREAQTQSPDHTRPFEDARKPKNQPDEGLTSLRDSGRLCVPHVQAARAPAWGLGQAAGWALLTGARMSHCLEPRPQTIYREAKRGWAAGSVWALSTCQPQRCTGPVGASSPKARSRPCAADIWNWALCLCKAHSEAEAGVGDRVTPVQGVGAWAPGQGLPWGWPPSCSWVSPPSKNLQGFPGRHGPGPSTLPHSPPGSLACPLGLPGSSSALNSQGDLYLMGTLALCLGCTEGTQNPVSAYRVPEPAR